jgi:DNA replication and repair protein RecF
LLAEREAIADSRDLVPLMLLDDVMSELDRDRREALVEVLCAGGQAVITTTDLEHVPGVADLEVTSLVVADGSVREGAVA